MHRPASGELVWFEKITKNARKESNDFFDGDALRKYLLTSDYSSLDVQTCVFLGYWTAKAMSSANRLNGDDIMQYGRLFDKLFRVLQGNSPFTQVVPEWLNKLVKRCLDNDITSEAIVKAFEEHGVDHKLHYCKAHQGIPIIITEHADCKELMEFKTTPVKKGTNYVNTEFPQGITILKRDKLQLLVGNFVGKTKEIVITRAKYDEKPVVVYRLMNSILPGGARIQDLPAFCSYINLRLRYSDPSQHASSLHSKYINPVVGVIDRDESDKQGPCLIMADSTTTTLFQYLVDTCTFKQYISWTKRVRIARDIAAGLKDLHDNQVTHKMLNPFTVLMGNDLSIKLSSFGLENVDQTTATSGGCCHEAPEVRQEKKHTFNSDVYAFGLILMELAGHHVHKNDDFGELLAMSTTMCPRWYVDLAKLCTMRNPENRPNITSILDELNTRLAEGSLDKPNGSIAFMELEKDKLRQAAVIDTNDIVNVYGGKYGDIDVLIKRPNDTPKNKNITPVKHLFNEFAICTRVQSQNIVNQYGILESNTSSPAVIVANMNMGNLKAFITRVEDKTTVDEPIKLHIAISVAQALEDLHDLDYVHCDVHASNVFLHSNRQVKLGNLTLAQPEGMLLSDVLFEYIHYLAPEVQQGRPYSKAADVYAFGKFLMYLDAFEEDEPSDRYKSSLKWCSDLVKKCCDADPKNRITMSQIVRLLKSFKTESAPNFLRVKIRDQVDLSEQLKEVPKLNTEEIVYNEVMGSGAFGAIQLGVFKDKKVAIKVFHDQHKVKFANDFAHEVLGLHRCQSSKYVVQLIGICLEERQIVMELMNCDLKAHMTSLSQKQTPWAKHQKLAVQATQAVVDMHELGVVHLDLKSENFLYSSNDDILKLADFGKARLIDEEWPEPDANTIANLGQVGTPGWKAPELILSRVRVQYIKMVDIYALGIVLNEIDTLKLPMTQAQVDMTPAMFERKLMEREIYLQFSSSCPKQYVEIAKKCYRHNPTTRPTARVILRNMEELMNATP